VIYPNRHPVKPGSVAGTT